MPEALTLTTPITRSVPDTTTYRVRRIVFGFDENFLHISLRDNNAVETHYRYDGPDAVALMRALNKTNLSTKSLHRRILERLRADGRIDAGPVTGSPD